ncbi:hypothetical protein PM082_007619 [Marasmius tenuissimus]|nr:hypothetical protein PM082_007619 [Marasmius tenuissimus]
MLFQRASPQRAETAPNPITAAVDSNDREEKHVEFKDPELKGKRPEQNHTENNPSRPSMSPTTPSKRRHSLEILVTKIRSSPRLTHSLSHPPTSLPTTPTTPKKIESVSGDSPVSHPGLCDSLTSPQKANIIHRDTFLCVGGVNMDRLLGATRQTMLERAEEAGANCLVDEKWKYTIVAPRRPRGAYKVQINYSAQAAKSSECDPHKPVALDCASGIPGLMTILERRE